MSNDRIWYMHRNGMKEGPLTLAEMLSRKKEGSLKPETQVWRAGMAGWVSAGQQTESTGGGREPESDRDYEQSLMIELNRGVREVEDRTTAIDRGMLRKAKGEAQQAVVLERRVSGRMPMGMRSAVAGRQSRGMGWTGFLAVAPVLAVAFAATGLRLGWLEPQAFGPRLSPYLERIFSPVPELSGVSASDHARLRAAVSSKRVDGVDAAWVFAPASIDEAQGKDGRLVVYLGSNLPDGAVVRAGLRGPVEVTFPLTVLHGLARSRPLETMKGQSLPSGSYFAFVVDGDEADQSVAALSWLRALPPDAAKAAGRLPAGLGENRRFVWGQQVELR